MVEVLQYFIKRITELENDNKSILNSNFGLSYENKNLKEKFKEIKRLIDEDYIEDGSFYNEGYIREIIDEVIKGEE